MGIMHLAFLFLGLFHLSLAKECSDCTNPALIQYIKDRLKNELPQGMETEEQAELVRIKEAEGLDNAFIYDFEAQGSKSNSLYDCKLVLQQGSNVFTKEYTCKVISPREQESSIYGEQLMEDVENKIKFNKKKYMNCMKKAAIRCLL